MKITELDHAPYIRLLVYGDSGSGKTTLMGTAMECEETFPMLVMNARGQPISLRFFEPRPLVLTVESMKDFNNIHDFFLHGQDFGRLEKYDKLLYTVFVDYLNGIEAERFGSVGIDSITHIQRIAMNEVTGFHGGPGDMPPQTQIQQWGRVLAQLTNLADLFFRLPIHVVMTALTRRDSIEAMGLTLYAPFLWGQSQLEIPAHAEIVGRLMCTSTIPVKDQKDVEKAADAARASVPFNMLYLSGGRDYIAKWQGVPKPPAILPSPTIAKLMNVIMKGVRAGGTP